MVAIYLGAKLIERHFTILPEDETRDGKVSINRDQLAEIVMFSELSSAEQHQMILERVPEYDEILGNKHFELSNDELLNRDYYRGRFCNKHGCKEIFNWETEPLINSKKV